MKPNILVVTNGYEGTLPAIQYAAWLGGAMNAPLTLMGVIEETDADHPVEEIFSEAIPLLKEKNVPYTLEVYEGNAEALIADRARKEDISLLIVGPFGRSQLRRWVVGRSFRAIMENVSIPILYVPRKKLPIQKVLICLGGLGYAVTVEHLGMKVAQMNRAEVTFLTVAQVDLQYPETRKILENLDHLEETDTLAGRALRQGMQTAQEFGLNAHIRVREGNVVEQILDEIKTSDYDLICMGSLYSAHSLRAMLSPNVTAEIAEQIHVPLLTARYAPAV
jgi:nucleotide-binding universal stress UspA family protein